MRPDIDNPLAFAHHDVVLNGLNWHFVMEGDGRLLVLLHGFPYTWYGWRKVLPELSASGYRVVAVDLPGYAGSDAPDDAERYTHIRMVGDLVALLGALGERSAALIGHDVGAGVAYAAAQMRPDLFPALVLLNTPPVARPSEAPAETWRGIRERTGQVFYQEYFAGEAAVRELDADRRKSLRASMFSISGQAQGCQRWRQLIAPGEGFLDTVFDPPALPSWLSERALDQYVEQYSRHGFRGALGPYRARGLNWERGAFLAGRAPAQPSLYIGGAADPAAMRLLAGYEALEQVLPGLRDKLLLPGVGHSAAEEAPEEIARLTCEFLAQTYSAPRSAPKACAG